jgi:cobalamin synthase
LVAFEPEAVFDGPEDRLDALADRRVGVFGAAAVLAGAIAAVIATVAFVAGLLAN